jgi:type II secretory pathway predicted ATPase ExeA
MTNVVHDDRALFGLTHHPFDCDCPLRGCWRSPLIDLCCRRIGLLARRGGFALLFGPPGTGKSVALRFLAEELRSAEREHTVAILERPHASLADFYRELGSLYGITLSPHNRWAGAAALRQQWRSHAEDNYLNAVLIVDEAQEMSSTVLNELRLLAGERLDAGWLLSVVLCGDDRLIDRLRSSDLAPLNSRIRIRIRCEELPPASLGQVLRHLITEAGNPALFAEQVIDAIAEQAGGNLRSLMHLADQLLAQAREANRPCVDQDLLLGHALDERSPTNARPARRKS